MKNILLNMKILFVNMLAVYWFSAIIKKITEVSIEKMNTLAIALMIVIALLLAGVIILLIQGRPKADMTAQRLELLERRLAESMYDLRGEQSTLARAARLENQAASDRLKRTD